MLIPIQFSSLLTRPFFRAIDVGRGTFTAHFLFLRDELDPVRPKLADTSKCSRLCAYLMSKCGATTRLLARGPHGGCSCCCPEIKKPGRFFRTAGRMVPTTLASVAAFYPKTC